MFQLRDYQEKCVKLVLDAYNTCNNGRELLVLPTGAGKTVIFAHIIQQLALQGVQALVIAHRDELLDQAADKYHLVNANAIIGKLGGGCYEYAADVVVAGVATASRAKHLARLKEQYGDGDKLFIVVDEAHHVAASGYKAILDALPQAFVLLVTATPDRLDGKAILPEKDPLYSASIIDMIRQRYLCDIKAIAVKTHVKLDNIRTTAGDFNSSDLDLAVNTSARNRRIVEAYKEHAGDKRTIAFCVTIDHAYNLVQEFQEAGIAASLVTGDTPLDERKVLYAQLKSGEIKVLCNVMVLTEGFDLPEVEAIIMARPTKSRSLYVQAIGRGLRLAENKPYCLILDISDNVQKHNLEPINIKRLFKKHLQDGELLLDAAAREEDEERKAEEDALRRKIERNLKEKRFEDVQIDLMQKIEWQERGDGVAVLHVKSHRLAVRESPTTPGVYDLHARLAPDFKLQQWLCAQPLELCIEIATRRARLIYADEKNVKWLDKTQPRQNAPATDKQLKMLRWYKIAVPFGCTVAQASELIDLCIAKKDLKEAAKAARQQAKQEQAEMAY